MSLFICPICGLALDSSGKAYRCPNGHSFDIASEGYTYLLQVNKKHSLSPGDDKAMASARRAFLDKGYYCRLRDLLCELAAKYCDAAPALLDAGCGEGYYSAGVFKALKAAGKTPRMAGIDISKFILKAAAKRMPDIEFAVASSYSLPLADSSVDLLLDCFSPLAINEFRRVLRPGGIFIYVVPAARHLWELKQILYEKPYPNEEKETPYEGFEYEEIVRSDTRITLDCREDIENLFRMTPYYWKTPKEGAERLLSLERLSICAEFCIHVFRRSEI
jgi:23S rRNA (guanine745-N1)-methyltransferase